MSAQVPLASAAAAAAAASLRRHRCCSQHCCCSIRLIKAIRSQPLPYSGNYAAVRPTEYRIVSSNFSAPRSTIHKHACACPDSACSVSVATNVGHFPLNIFSPDIPPPEQFPCPHGTSPAVKAKISELAVTRTPNPNRSAAINFAHVNDKRCRLADGGGGKEKCPTA